MQETLDPLDESKYILKEIQKYMKKGVDLKQMAVLYRTGEDARVLAETFTQYQIPFSMKERIHHLYEHFVCTVMTAISGWQLELTTGEISWRSLIGRSVT